MTNNNNSNPEDGSSSSKPSPSFFQSLSSYNRFRLSRSQRLDSLQTSDDDDDSIRSYSLREISSAVKNSKPSPSFFQSLSSYNRFRLSRSTRLDDSLQTSPIPIPIPIPIPYSFREISSAVKISPLPPSPSPPSGLCTVKDLTIPCDTFKRCTLRNKMVVIFCRHLLRHSRADPKPHLSPSHLSALSSGSDHPSIVKLLGASHSPDGGHLYMVYEDIPGATLRELLRTISYNSSNPLSNWIWRMQVALDLARGLEHIHHHCGMVHNMIKSSTVIVTEPNSNACICLFGANDFQHGHIEGMIGYAAPEFLIDGIISQKSDVYAFGVVILELISGKAEWEWKEDKVVYLVQTARETICGEVENEDDEIRRRRRRRRVMEFVDRRLHDLFPMETTESLIKLALKCAEDVPELRPEMASVAEDIQRLFLDSKLWQKETMNSPTTPFSLSSFFLEFETMCGLPQGLLSDYPSLGYY